MIELKVLEGPAEGRRRPTKRSLMVYSDPEKQRRYQREWLAKRRADFFVDKVCAICGSTEGLELDHVNPVEKVSHHIWSWTQTKREAEIAKCQILCSHHHELKSSLECKRGSDLPYSVLTEEEVVWARLQRLWNQTAFTEMGQRLNVKPDTVRKAVRSGWNHIRIPPIAPEGTAQGAKRA